MTVKWFGQRRDAPIYKPEYETTTPVGEPCIHCEKPIAAGDDGFLYANGPAAHRDCFLHAVGLRQNDN